MDKHKDHFIEIDIIRGIAIILMIIYHLMWDLNYFGIVPMDKNFYSETVIIIPILFLTIVGVSLSIAYTRHGTKKAFKHSFIILICASIVSFFSFILLPAEPVYFGILHCIGISILLALPLLRINPKLLMGASFIMLASGFFISLQISQLNFFTYMIGIHNQTIASIDYFPLLPWFGVVLFGVSLGGILYKDGKRQFPFPDVSHHKPVKAVTWMGKHSLAIYIAHQPVIAGTIIYVVPVVMPIITKYIYFLLTGRWTSGSLVRGDYSIYIWYHL
jgi:uncharacterized membrane protein